MVWKFQIYVDRAREYRWRLVAPNGDIIADSGEGYETRYNARRGAENVRVRIAQAQVEDI